MIEYYFVIDTDTWSENFKEPMFSHITGQLGPNKYEEIASPARHSLGPHFEILRSVIGSREDRFGNPVYFDIYKTPGFYNNGMGFHYKKGEEEIAQAEYKKAWIEESAKPHLFESDRVECLEKAFEPMERHPAYQSVVLYLASKPNKNIVSILKQRAVEFEKLCKNKKIDLQINFSITGFRVIKTKENDMDFNSLIEKLRDILNESSNTEDDLERMTRVMSALRDYSEARRQEVVQERLNRECMLRHRSLSDKAYENIVKLIED